jgi:hypothetical protein
MRLPNINKLEGQVMSPGFQIAPLKISGPDAVEFLKQRQRLAFEACYCSTLDECWVLSVPNLAEESTTIAVEDCKADAKPFESVNAKTLDRILEKLSPDAGTH